MAFKIGDDVVCVDDTGFSRFPEGTRLPIAGHSYTVRAVLYKSTCLHLLEIVNDPRQFDEGLTEPSFKASRFLALRGKKRMPVFTVRGPIVIPPGGSFTPADLSPRVWVESDGVVNNTTGGSQCADGQTAQQWVDLTANVFDLLQNNSTFRPTFRSSVDGFPAVQFASANNNNMKTGVVVTLPTADQVWAYIVFKFSTFDANDRLVTFTNAGGDADAATKGIPFLTTNTPTVLGFRNGSGLSASATLSTNTWYRGLSVWDGSNHTMYIDNVASTPSASSGAFTTPTNLMLCADPDDISNPDCHVRTLIFGSGSLSAGDKDNLQSYYATKWGLSP